MVSEQFCTSIILLCLSLYACNICAKLMKSGDIKQPLVYCLYFFQLYQYINLQVKRYPYIKFHTTIFSVHSCPIMMKNLLISNWFRAYDSLLCTYIQLPLKTMHFCSENVAAEVSNIFFNRI